MAETPKSNVYSILPDLADFLFGDKKEDTPKQIIFNSPANIKYSDTRNVPKAGKDTGYLNGYENTDGVNIVDIKLTGADKILYEKIPTYIPEQKNIGDTYQFSPPIRYQQTPEYDTDTFKYGINNVMDDFDAPTYLGFEIYINNEDESIFCDDDTKNKLKNFILKYKDIPDIYERIDLFNTFKNYFLFLFHTTVNDKSEYKYTHNVTSVKGLNLLTKKITNYPEDKITITLNEDLSMIAQIIAESYNNLIYSYRYNRYMIPEHLLRFDMSIKITDMRRFRSKNPNFDPTKGIDVDNNPYTLSNKNANIVYTLHDCNLNFFNSQNVEDALTIGGYDIGANKTPAVLSFDIIFKSVSKSLESVASGINITNKDKIKALLNTIDQNNAIFDKAIKNDDKLIEWNKLDLYRLMANPDYTVATPAAPTPEEKLNLSAAIKAAAIEAINNAWIELRRNLIQRALGLIELGHRWLDNKFNLHGMINVYEDERNTGGFFERAERDFRLGNYKAIAADLKNIRSAIINGGATEMTKYIMGRGDVIP